ncbi:MAG: 4'-phosphopantetheinyl transferase superfamily protein [Desulfobacterales bacterium]|jgi:4'-phosphopantetheinyl transferase|nr:4'-phosphopantetheinyl transferase superfamily protein [Desulfobacterales bacterium]
MELEPDQVHLWICYPDQIRDATLLSTYGTLLSPEENARKERFIFPEHRHQYLVSRALVRSTLSRYADYPPECWQFSKNEHGRPEIILPEGVARLRFNLSHTAGIIACAVVLEQPIGVDAESARRKINAMQIAKRYFSEQEITALTALSGTDQQFRFFQYWTLKESFSKAKGLGLTLALNQYSFHSSADGAWHVTCDPSMREEETRWRFWSLQPTSRHLLAVSVRQRPAHRYDLTTYETVPLQLDKEISCS